MKLNLTDVQNCIAHISKEMNFAVDMEMNFTKEYSVFEDDVKETILVINNDIFVVINFTEDPATGHVERFVVFHKQVIPGCWTLRNGDPGYPDDVDMIDDGEFISEKDVARKIFTMLFNDGLTQSLMLWDLEKSEDESD